MALLSIIFAAILQFGIIIHVRNTLIDAASAGARTERWGTDARRRRGQDPRTARRVDSGRRQAD
ncbi:TadE family protein, partial [Citricoccus parietis]